MIIGENVKKYPEEWDEEVQMWVFQEKVNRHVTIIQAGSQRRKLSDMNKTRSMDVILQI